MNAQLWVDGAGMLIGSGVVAWLYNWLRNRRTAPTDNTVRLSAAAMGQVESAMRQVDQLQEQLADAQKAAMDFRRASDDARREADEARREMRQVSRAAEELAGRVDRIVEWIHDPYMSLERLRVMVPPPLSGTMEVRP